MKITWLGQAGFMVSSAHGSFAVDPFMGTAKGNSERLYPPILEKNAATVDMILTTHAHWDHFDPETYSDYIKPGVIIGPGSCMKALAASGLPIPGIELNRRGVLERCGFKITATFADHDADSVGFLVEADGARLFFSGDTLLTVKSLLPAIGLAPDIAFVCINGKLGNMNYFEAASFCKALGAEVGVPTHYDMIRHNTEEPKEFTDALSRIAPGVRSFVMERGHEYELSEILGRSI